jgi:hypothetical protein
MTNRAFQTSALNLLFPPQTHSWTILACFILTLLFQCHQTNQQIRAEFKGTTCMKSPLANSPLIPLSLWLLLALKATAATNSISAGQTTNGFIALGETNYYSFTASSNDTVTILAATVDFNTFPSVELQGPDGAMLASASGNLWPWSMAYLDTIRLTNDGTYLILVHDDADNQSYDYGLTLVKNPGPNTASAGGPILPGQTVTNSLNGPGAMHVYSFTASSNDTVTILAATVDFNTFPSVELQGPDGAMLASASGNLWPWSMAYLDTIRLTNDGTYLILVRDDHDSQSYDYGLTLVKNPGPNTADLGETNLIKSGQTVTGAIDRLADVDVYSFDAIVGDSITASFKITGGSVQNPIFQLYAPDGTLLRNVSGSPNARVQYSCVPQTGSYLLLCRDDVGNETFNYTLTFGQTPGAPPTNTPPEYLQACNCPDQVWVRWSTNAAGFRLQSTEQLASPASVIWSNVQPPYGVSGGYYVVTNTFPPSMKFFRLIKP